MSEYQNLSKEELILLLKDRSSSMTRFKNLLHSLPGSIYWKDRDGIYIGHNEYAQMRMQRLFADAGTIIGKSDHDLFPKDVADLYRKNDLEVMQTGKESMREEIVTYQGQVIVQLSSKKPYYDENGQVAGVIGNTVDITRLKEIEAELKEAKESAEYADNYKSQIIKNMEHDIRTPFAGILALSNLLYAQEENVQKKQHLASINDCAEELLNYCNELVEMTKLEAGKITQTHSQFDLRELIENLIRVETPAATTRGLTMTVVCDESIGRMVTGDHSRLYRVLLNLLSNAIKFTHKGKITIRLDRLLGQVYPDATIRIRICDTGIGIPADKFDFIFEKFTRLSPANQGIKGTGLGLSVVKQFVADMNGRIRVESQLGKGSTFIIDLPLDEDHEQTIPVSKEPINSKYFSSYQPHVLLVEDHNISRKVGATVLAECHCRVDVAATGAEAVRLCEINLYDLIFVDIGLPDMDGWEVIEKVRHNHSLYETIPIIILTAHSSGDYQDNAERWKIHEFITKPLTIEKACKVLSEMPEPQKMIIDGTEFYYHHTFDKDLYDEIFMSEHYDLNTENPTPTIIDAGAHIGLATIFFKKRYPDANILCFEPDPFVFRILEKNMKLHHFNDVQCIPAALSNKKERQLFYGEFGSENVNSVGNSLISEWGLQREVCRGLEVDCVCLSDYVNGPIDFLKLDVEGAEFSVIAELGDKMQLIKKLVMEVHLTANGHGIDDFLALQKHLARFFSKIQLIKNPFIDRLPAEASGWVESASPELYLLIADH